MDYKPDTIHVTVSQREEIDATHADLYVTVRGSSVISGNEALKKAREVSTLVDELKKVGIPVGDIHLQGVKVSASSGAIIRTSSAAYQLRVRCMKLEGLPELLDILGSRKNVSLDQIAWRYAEEEARASLLETAIAKAKSKAGNIAAALGVKLLGVYSFNEMNMDEETHFQVRQPMMLMEAKMEERGPSLDMEIQHTKFIQVNVELEYRVSEL